MAATGYVYPYPGLADARERLEQYRDKAKALAAAARDPLSEAMYVGEVVGSGYLVSMLSGRAGPDGRTLFGIPIELLIGGALGGAALVLVGRNEPARAGESPKGAVIAEHLLALGSGAIGAYTARLGFQAGLARAKPAEEPSASQVSGAPAQPTTICYLPAPAHWMLPATTQAPAMTPAPAMMPAPATVPAASTLPASSAVTAGDPFQEYFAPVLGEENTSIGADEIQSAVEVLDRLNRK
jgi:hypothetical protein